MCAMNPLGRILLFYRDTKRHEFHYFLKPFNCAASKGDKVTVGEWIDRSGIEAYDECVKVYKRLGGICSALMHEMKTDEEKQDVFTTSFYLMYLNYTRNEPLYEQLIANVNFFGKSEGEKQYE